MIGREGMMEDPTVNSIPGNWMLHELDPVLTVVLKNAKSDGSSRRNRKAPSIGQKWKT